MEFKNRRVAVFPAGTEIGLELHRSLQYATWFSTYGISSVEDHSRLVYQEWTGEVPWIGEPDFLTRLNFVLQREHIQYLYSHTRIDIPFQLAILPSISISK